MFMKAVIFNEVTRPITALITHVQEIQAIWVNMFGILSNSAATDTA